MEAPFFPEATMPCDDPRYDLALAAAILIVNTVQAGQAISPPQLVSFIAYTCLDAIRQSECRLRLRMTAIPSPN
jgi:hypothetical protein